MAGHAALMQGWRRWSASVECYFSRNGQYADHTKYFVGG